ncbi:hypothetical protein [Cellulosimicrobium sp. CUA-896]|uniref:hypothetical protein n=1 Tax=Cellulosimicrobium sp. CUA-896 TaxID=1517881 RepID=UPI000965AD29|nr:hypothetical protein [Cellulosimicrobium sp. CUA-896]OLT55212.1 hypothetical protein BJF88_07175 [Cellulosimicrobium sp. CUA-896]
MDATVDEAPVGRTDAPLNDSTLLTYRYLRTGIVAMAVLLALSLSFAIVGADAPLRGSISSYYYTPVRSVFVGALVAIGLALIAIRGKGWEETLLNLAGMLAPVVALVPTRVRPTPPAACADGASTCVPPDLVPGIENNMRALFVVGALTLVFAWWTAWSSRGREQVGGSAVRAGLAVTTAVALLFGLWLFVDAESFLSAGHNTAAITMFACIVAVVIITRAASRPRARTRSTASHRASSAGPTARWRSRCSRRWPSWR